MEDNGAKLAAAVGRIKGVQVDESAIRAHEMRPQQLAGVHSDRGKEDEPIIQNVPPQPGVSYQLNIQGFSDAVQASLTNLCAGYSLRLNLFGVASPVTLNWSWAKQPQDGSESWLTNVRMHVASLSKIVTAIAMTKVLNHNGLSFDTPIIGFLPAYWSKGPNVSEITFAQLMTHKSGLAFFDLSGRTDFEFMKEQVAFGAPNIGRYSYQNMNFGLCRILITTVNGYSVNAAPNDSMWDSVTLAAYQAFVQANVFSPAGVTNATLVHQPADALAYNFPVSGKGWNSGDITELVGGTGWHTTLDQFLALMSTFRRGGTIMSPADAQTLLENGFGIDSTVRTTLGFYYAKNGGWSDGEGHMEQCVAFYLPQDMELVLFVNSPIGFALPGQLLSYGDSGTRGNVSDPVIVGLGAWTEYEFLFAGTNLRDQARIYGVNPESQLVSFADSGVAGNVSDPVVVGFGTGWEEFKTLFAGTNLEGQNCIYAVNQAGELLSFSDTGAAGNVRDSVIVGPRGWADCPFVFAGANLTGQPCIYAVNQSGQLLSFSDTGRPGNVLDSVVVGFGSGWADFKFLFAGENSAFENRIYAVNQAGQLLSYVDTGAHGNVSNSVTVGLGAWTGFKFLFAGMNSASQAQARIYGVWAQTTSTPPGPTPYSVVANAYTSNIVEVP